jgi:hypothetical protein
MSAAPNPSLHDLPVMRDRDLSPIARACWLLLRNQGGWWSASEVAREFGGIEQPGGFGCALAALERRGHVARASHRSIPAYGVTHRCLPITGETLEPRISETQPMESP